MMGVVSSFMALSNERKILYVCLALISLVTLIYSIVETALLNDKYYPSMAYKGDGILSFFVLIFIVANIVATVLMFVMSSHKNLFLIINIVATSLQLIFGFSFAITTYKHFTRVWPKITENVKKDHKAQLVYALFIEDFCNTAYLCEAAISYTTTRTASCCRVAFLFHSLMTSAAITSIIYVYYRGGRTEYDAI